MIKRASLQLWTAQALPPSVLYSRLTHTNQTAFSCFYHFFHRPHFFVFFHLMYDSPRVIPFLSLFWVCTYCTEEKSWLLSSPTLDCVWLQSDLDRKHSLSYWRIFGGVWSGGLFAPAACRDQKMTLMRAVIANQNSKAVQLGKNGKQTN